MDVEYEAVLKMMDEEHYGKGLRLPRVERSIPDTYKKIVGHPMNSQTIKAKVCGDPLYSMDLDEFSSQMTYGAYVLTTQSSGRVAYVDLTESKKVPGFVAYTDASDIPNKVNGNCHSGIQMDTPVFVKNGEIIHKGEPIGLITCETRDAALLAARLAVVHYETPEEDATKAPCTIQEAMAANSYLPNCGVGERVLQMGDWEKALSEAAVTVEGECTLGGQDHYYAETHNCVVYVQENGALKVFSSTQNPSKMQFDIAWNLNDPNHAPADATGIKSEAFVQNAQVEVEVLAVGGGFGGKQDRPHLLCTAAAIAAHKTGRSVKLSLDRDTDLCIMGGRHPYYFRYRAGMDAEGRYTALDLLLVQDGGSTFDCSGPVLDKSIYQCQSCYTIPNIRVEGRSAKTHRVTNTAFRGFGAPQATYVQETIVDHLAEVWYNKFGRDAKFGLETYQDAAFYVRRQNIHRAGDRMLTQTLVSTRVAEHLTRTLFARLCERVDIP